MTETALAADLSDEERVALWRAFSNGEDLPWLPQGPQDAHWTAAVDRMLAALSAAGRLADPDVHAVELAATRLNRDEIAATLSAIWEALGLSGGDDPVHAIRRLRTELDNANHQHQAVQNQVDSLVREMRRLQHAETRAVRYALEKDRDVAEVDAKLAARDAEIARLNAREAATQVNLYDANLDVEDLRSRLKATSDAYNDAENQMHTKTEVARGNKQHVAVLTELVERVEKYADRLANYCSPHGVTARYAAELRAELTRPTEAERAGATRPTPTNA